MKPSKILITGHDGHTDKNVSIGSEIHRQCLENWTDAEYLLVSEKTGYDINKRQDEFFEAYDDFEPDLFFNNAWGQGANLKLAREAIKRRFFTLMITTGTPTGFTELTGDNQKYSTYKFWPERTKKYALDHAKLWREAYQHRSHACYHGKPGEMRKLDGTIDEMATVDVDGITQQGSENNVGKYYGENLFWTHFVFGPTRTAEADADPSEHKYDHVPMLDPVVMVSKMMNLVKNDDWVFQWVQAFEPPMSKDPMDFFKVWGEVQDYCIKRGW